MDLKELARVLNITEDEAREVQQTDKRIDRGEKLFELPPELEAGAKKARRADEDKRDLIHYLEDKLEDAHHYDMDLDNITITNPERELEFTYNGKKYRLTLMRPRK